MIYIIYYKTDYIDFIFKGVDASLPVEFIELNNHRNFFHRLLIKIIPDWFPNIPSFFINRKFRKKLGALKSSDQLLIIDYSDKQLLRAIKNSLNKKPGLFYWAWNPIKKDGLEYFQKIKNIGFSPYSFEPKDAKQCQIGLLNQFYRMKVDYYDVCEIKYDFYFIGFIKKRGDEIEQMRSYLTEKGFSVLFHVVDNINQTISYEQNIKNILASKCLIEIVEDGLKGVTLRPLEALAFNRKLLTNNQNIVSLDFFNENNICVYDEDINLSGFMNKSNVNISEEIINKYDVNTWIKSFLINRTVS
jgi:hypothetical protein